MVIPDGELDTLPVSDLYATFVKTIAANTAHALPLATATTSSTAVESAAAVPSDATSCPWPGCWYDAYWATPLTWMLFCYCFVSAFIMFALWCGGYLSWRLDLADPYRRDPSRRPPNSTNEIWRYQQNQYRQRQRDRAAAREDPAAGLFEELQRRYSAVGVYVSIEQLQYQMQLFEHIPPATPRAPQSNHGARSVSESPDLMDELRALERERHDRIVVARLRQQGLM